jgi:hypothetical protein
MRRMTKAYCPHLWELQGHAHHSPQVVGAWHQSFTLVILATKQAEIRRVIV